MPFFSIIIPLYNKEKFIENTIQSALEQSFEDFELIVVNDGSTDKSLELVNKLNDKRIKTYSISNAGVSKARNFGIQKATSNLIVFLDADDLWKKNHLEELFQLRKAYPHCGLYAMGYTKKYDNSNPINAHYFGLKNHSGVVPDFFMASTADCVAWTSAVMVPKDVFKTIGYFNQGLKSGQDTEMWIRIAIEYKVAFCSNPTACKVQRSHEDHLSISKYKIERLKIFKQFKDEEIKNLSLKRYLDLNRFSMAIERKKSGDFKNYKLLKKSISIKNLNAKQRLLLGLPKAVLIGLTKIQRFLLKRNIYLTAFRT
tara:strand:+ start:576 stop:1514 length:939 start_codon:yes stop_codon:yes gene_type:complete